MTVNVKENSARDRQKELEQHARNFNAAGQNEKAAACFKAADCCWSGANSARRKDETGYQHWMDAAAKELDSVGLLLVAA